MSGMFNHFCFVLLFVFVATAVADFECSEDSDCLQYHYCDYTYSGFESIGSQCISNLDAVFGPTCNGDSSICQENDESEASTAMCFEHEGKYGCRNSYFMPCSDESDCAQGFGCEFRSFTNGQASVCVPNQWYSGGGGPCTTNHDCGYAIYFGNKWMPCHGGRCARIVAK